MAKKPESSVPLFPTPHVGQWVHYYRDDLDLDSCAAAVCTVVEGPGKVSLAIINPNSTMFNVKKGVNWAGNDQRLHASRPFRLAGVWDFIPGQTPRDALKYHRDLLERRELDAKKQAEQQERLREEREQRHREMQQAVSDD